MPASASELATARQHDAYIIDCARASGLVTDHDIVEGLRLERMVELLPKSALAKVVRSAIEGWREGRPFDYPLCSAS